MSFITQTIGRRASSIIPRVATQAPRFSTTTRLEKGPVDAAKDGLKTVDRAVSDKLVDGIDIAGMPTLSQSRLIHTNSLVQLRLAPKLRRLPPRLPRETRVLLRRPKKSRARRRLLLQRLKAKPSLLQRISRTSCN